MRKRLLFVLIVAPFLFTSCSSLFFWSRDEAADTELGLLEDDPYQHAEDALANNEREALEEQQRYIQRQIADPVFSPDSLTQT